MLNIAEYSSSSYAALKSYSNVASSHVKTIPAEAKILVVDDDRLYQDYLSVTLKKAGAKHVFIAATGIEAITLAKLHTPHLIILDLNMPEMDGFTCCKTLRTMEAFKHTPILVQTGMQDEESRLHVFELGASDYLTKPINAKELVARSCVHLERSLLLNNIQSHLTLLKRDLIIAKEMQRTLLPSEQSIQALEHDYQLKISTHFTPSDDVGGDTWGIRKLSDHQLAIFTCDFSGQGISSAINIFRFHTLIKETLEKSRVPSHWINTINTAMLDLLPLDQFAKIFFAILDIQNNTLTYSGAGSPRPVFIQHHSGKYSLLNTRGFPVGIVDDAEYHNYCISLEQHDSLIIYSDALLKNTCFKQYFNDDNDICLMARHHFEEARMRGLPPTSGHETFFRTLEDSIKSCSNNNVIDDIVLTMITRR